MRNTYADVLKERIAKKDFFWIFRKGWKYCAIYSSSKLHKQMAGPLWAGLYVTYRCNSKCLMCGLQERYLRNKDKREELSAHELHQLIDQLARIGTEGVIFSGGEPFLRKEILFLADYAHEKGMYTLIATNAFLLDEPLCDEIMKSKLDILEVSLDGLGATHDRLRGLPGNFGKACDAVRYIVGKRKNGRPKINICTAISRENIQEILPLVNTVADLGVNSILFNIANIMGFGGEKREEMRSLLFDEKGAQELDRVIDSLKSLKKKTSIIDNSLAYLEAFKLAARGKPIPCRCLASQTSINVDTYGNIFPCFGFLELNRPLGNIRDLSLVDFWFSSEYKKKKKKMESCRDCYFACNLELSMLFRCLP